MKLDGINLTIGVGIGVGVMLIAMTALIIQSGENVHSDLPMIVNAVTNNQSHFFMSGLLDEISDNAMILDQTFGRPDFNDNAKVTVRLDGGAAFVICSPAESANSCKESILNRLGKEPVYICAHTRMLNGEFYAGKIWADAGCGPNPIEEQNDI